MTGMYFDVSLTKLPWSFLMDGLFLSLRICIIAFSIGLIGGLFLAVASLSRGPLRFLARAYVSTFRSVPLIMVLLWFYLIAPDVVRVLAGVKVDDLRLTSAIIGFSVFEAAYCSEILRAGIQNISSRQLEAARCLGLTYTQAMRLVIIPQALRKISPLLLTQAIILFQDTTLVYVISLTDFFGAALRIGERDGLITELLLLSGVSYFLICLLLSKSVQYWQQKKLWMY
jgi:glutamate/aspartate transport system permease protein